MNVSGQVLIDDLECANIYKGNLTMKKTDWKKLIEMILYGCITENINKKNRRYIHKTS